MLLSETELRAALEPLLDRVLSERLRLFQLQFEARLNALARAAAPPPSAAAEPGLQRLFQAADPEHCFATLFEHSRELAAPARALLVEWRGELAVWRSEGLELPARFARAEAESVLRGLRREAIAVRGRHVGLLCWRGAEPAPAARSQLDLFIQAAGLVLLNLALEAMPGAAPPAGAAAEIKVPPAPEPRTPAGRFARLLLEDLALYLRRERPRELAEGRRLGDWRSRFGPELERCRRAFRERYPESAGSESQVFEEALQRLPVA